MDCLTVRMHMCFFSIKAALEVSFEVEYGRRILGLGVTFQEVIKAAQRRAIMTFRSFKRRQFCHDINFHGRYHDHQFQDFDGNGDAEAALQAIKARVLIIAVKEDPLFDLDEALWAHGLISNSKLVEIESAAGHGACCVDPEAVKIIDSEIAKFLADLQ